jgi:ATP synthase protein I
MSESEPPDRLAQLGRRLEVARARGGKGKPAAGSDDPALQQGMAVGLRIGVEFVVAILVATVLGWGLDRWLGTSPWLTIVLFFLGVGAGMVSVFRAVTGVKMAVGYRPPGPRREPTGDKWDDDEE